MKKFKIIVTVLFFLLMIAVPIFAGDNTLKCNDIELGLQHKTLEIKLRIGVTPEAIVDENGLERCPTFNENFKRITELFPDYSIVEFNDKQ